MEIKNPETRPSQSDLVSTNINIINGEEEISSSSSSRCYTCTFCKRGFSNAQALGGHMNVHRRDRAARLQAESIQEETLVSTQATLDLNSVDHDQPQAQSSFDDDVAEGSAPKRPWFLTQATNNHKYPGKKDDDNDVISKKQLLQLSLSSSTSTDPHHSSNKLISSSPTEVDLELRLGMDTEKTSRDRVIRDDTRKT